MSWPKFFKLEANPVFQEEYVCEHRLLINICTIGMNEPSPMGSILEFLLRLGLKLLVLL